eukprot:4546723-Pleurochrysis_carterae.AAC.1
MLRAALLLALFDFKYFFHQFAYALHGAWKMGFVAPASAAGGKASGDEVWALLELVMAMGWTRASGIAQDAGNGFMRRLLLLVDDKLSTYVAEQCRASGDFRAYWRRRERMPHDATYGTQARLVAALQYTDDMLVAAVDPRAAVAVLVCFTDMIGPCAYLDENAGEAGRGTAVRLCLLAGGTPTPAQVTAPGGARPPGTVRICRVDAAGASDAVRVCIARGSALGLPFDADGDARRSVSAYAHACACIAGDYDEEVARALRLSFDPAAAPGGRDARERALRAVVEALDAGRDVELACDCAFAEQDGVRVPE